MAEEKKILVDIEINSEDIKKANDAMASSAKSAALLTLELNKLKAEQQANAKAAKDGAISATELASRQAGLKLKMTETSKALAATNKDYANNKIVVDAAKGSNEQLRARLSILTKEYNGLSKEQRQNSKEGEQMGANIKALSDKLKANEKAVGDNRRNVGNYKDQLKEAAIASGSFGSGLVGMASGLKSATLASLKFLATPLGAVIGVIGLAIGLVVGGFKLMTASLNRTEDGAAALTGVMNVFKGVMSGVLTVVEPIALFLVEGLADGFEALGKMVESSSKQIQKALKFLGLNDAANGLANVTATIKDTSSATAQLAKAEAELNKIQRQQGIIQLEFQTRAEKQRQIRDDESKSLKERIQANKDLGDVLTEQSDAEMKLANRVLEIAKLRIKANGEGTEELDKLAEAQLKIREIEERVNSQRSEQMTNENSLRRDGVALVKEANDKKIKAIKELSDKEKEAESELIKRFEDQRALIDEAANIEKNNAIISIDNAEERAEAIAFIDREALNAKLMSLDDETAAYTASADMVGAVDEVKYAKQLAQRAAFEAELAETDRAARAEEFTNKIEALALDEQLETEAAELSITNTEDLEKARAEIALKFLGVKLELMTKLAEADGILTDEELKNLQLVENAIARIQGKLTNTDENPTLADMIGLSEDDVADIQLGLTVVSGLLSSIQSAIAAGAENRIKEIDETSAAEIAAVEASAVSEDDKAKKIKAINKKAAQDKFKIELEQFKVAKALSVALAIANTATAVMAQLSNPTPYVGFVLAALAAVTGGIQIGIASSQKPPSPPKFASGGFVSGPGTGTSDSIDAKLSNGESVNNAKTTKMFGREISAMNAAGGGVDWYKGQGGTSNRFADGGIVSPTFAARQTATSASMTKADFANALADMPQPVVRVTEINDVQGRVVAVTESTNL